MAAVLCFPGWLYRREILTAPLRGAHLRSAADVVAAEEGEGVDGGDGGGEKGIRSGKLLYD